MKKLLFIPALLAFASVNAQTPQNKSVPMVQKATATWCGPCGQWGWTLQEDITTDNSAKAIVMACYGSSSSDLFNQAAEDLTAWGQSWPNWAVNNVNRTAFSSTGGIYPSTTQTTIKSTVDSFAATSPIASTGYTYTISGNNISINTITKFWQATTGQYYLTAYMIEDGVMNSQNGQTGIVAHHNVLRGSVTASTFGDMIASGSIAANQTYNKNFSFTITDATWVKANIKVVVVLWKMNGSNYTYVNGNNHNDFPAGVADVNAVENLTVYPNPASEWIVFSGNPTNNADVQAELVNAVGQVVYTKNITNTSQFEEKIDLKNLSNGLYMLHLTSNGNTTTRKVVVKK